MGNKIEIMLKVKNIKLDNLDKEDLKKITVIN